jgi:hypothetical protein
MRRAIAAVVGGLVGFLQIMTIAFLDERAGRPPIKGDLAAVLFVVLMCLDVMAVIALSMFRVSPFVARLLGDTQEAQRIEESKKIRRFAIQTASAIIILLQRIVVAVSDGHVSKESAIALAVALLPFALPAPKNA